MHARLLGLNSLPSGPQECRIPDLRLGEIASRFGDSASVRIRSLAALRASEKRYQELFETEVEPTAGAAIDASTVEATRLPGRARRICGPTV